MNRIIYVAIMLLCFNGNIILGSYFGNVLNESVSDTLDIYHLVDRQSEFHISFFRTIVDSGDTDVADFKVRNNTIDGYQVLISSQNGGVFSPASTLDGESDIPYSILITYSGTLGTNVSSVDTISSGTLSTGSNTEILDVNHQTSPTDVEGVITISINDTNNQFMMAGSYSDTITITYVDN